MNKKKTLILLALFCALAFSAVVMGGEGVSIDEAMTKFFAAENSEQVEEVIKAIVASGGAAADVEKKLAEGRAYEPVPEDERGWKILYNECMDKKKRQYHLYIPEGYDPTKKYPVIFDLRGGIRATITPEQLKPRRKLWGPFAKENGYFVVIPDGDADAVWWSDCGRKNLLDVLETVKRNYNIDENRAYMSGFSDGASGAFCVGLSHPTKWAAFLPYSGHLAIARHAPFQAYPGNLAARPIRATNGGKDRLYPAAQVKEFYVDALKSAGVDIQWTEYPEAGHSLSYMEKEFPVSKEFMEKNPRKPFPSKINWSTSDLKLGRVDWLEITEIAETRGDSKIDVFNIYSKPGPIRLGFYPNMQFQGEGVEVARVLEKSLAAEMGLDAKDVITKINDQDIKSLQDLQNALGKLKHGSEVKVIVTRDGESKKLSAKVPPFEKKPVFSREKLTAAIRAEYSDNVVTVKTAGVGAFTIFVSSKMFDLAKPVVVKVNGSEVFNGFVKPDVEFMLKRAFIDNDREAVYCAKLEVNLKGTSGAREEKKGASPEKDEGKKEEEEKTDPDKKWR